MNEPASLLEYLVAAERIVVFTGAGISTAAGIPDYRGPGGIAKTRPEIDLHRYLTDSEKQREYLTFKSQDYFLWRDAEPTPAHHALIRLQSLGKLRAVITQNIDGLHRRSGLDPDRLVELHGCNDRLVCVECGYAGDAEPGYAAFRKTGHIPHCPECGHVLKPGVIQFGEALNADTLMRAQQAMMDLDLVIAVGSTLTVQPAASFPLMAARAGVPYLIINQGETAHDGLPHVSLRLEGDVQTLLPEAVNDAAAMFG